MTRKRKRRSSIIEVGNGPARVRIYTINRSDGYSQFTLAWKEGGRRTTRCVSCMDEARIIAQQIHVQLLNGFQTKRAPGCLSICRPHGARLQEVCPSVDPTEHSSRRSVHLSTPHCVSPDP